MGFSEALSFGSCVEVTRFGVAFEYAVLIFAIIFTIIAMYASLYITLFFINGDMYMRLAIFGAMLLVTYSGWTSLRTIATFNMRPAA